MKFSSVSHRAIYEINLKTKFSKIFFSYFDFSRKKFNFQNFRNFFSEWSKKKIFFDRFFFRIFFSDHRGWGPRVWWTAKNFFWWWWCQCGVVVFGSWHFWKKKILNRGLVQGGPVKKNQTVDRLDKKNFFFNLFIFGKFFHDVLN